MAGRGRGGPGRAPVVRWTRALPSSRPTAHRSAEVQKGMAARSPRTVAKCRKPPSRVAAVTVSYALVRLHEEARTPALDRPATKFADAVGEWAAHAQVLDDLLETPEPMLRWWAMWRRRLPIDPATHLWALHTRPSNIRPGEHRTMDAMTDQQLHTRPGPTPRHVPVIDRFRTISPAVEGSD